MKDENAGASDISFFLCSCHLIVMVSIEFKLQYIAIGNMIMLQEAKAYAQENGLFFMETSAKTAINVNDVFYEIGE